jgi:membrane-associated phospholipid phosphatase
MPMPMQMAARPGTGRRGLRVPWRTRLAPAAALTTPNTSTPGSSDCAMVLAMTTISYPRHQSRAENHHPSARTRDGRERTRPHRGQWSTHGCVWTWHWEPVWTLARRYIQHLAGPVGFAGTGTICAATSRHQRDRPAHSPCAAGSTEQGHRKKVRKSLWGMDMTASRETFDPPAPHRGRALALAAVAIGSAAGFGALAAAVARRDTAQADEAVRKRTAAPRGHPVRRAAEAAAPIGKWWTYLPGALVASAWLLASREGRGERGSRSRMAGAGAVLLAGTVATALNPTFDDVLPQPPAPPGHPSRRKPVFPSGHAFGPGAIGFTAAYVLAREEIARPAIALPVAAVLPLATSGGRVLQEKHWASDVLGGYLGGLALAAACAAAYEAVLGAWANEEAGSADEDSRVGGA